MNFSLKFSFPIILIILPALLFGNFTKFEKKDDSSTTITITSCPENQSFTFENGIIPTDFLWPLPTAVNDCPGDLLFVQVDGPTPGETILFGLETIAFEVYNGCDVNIGFCRYFVNIESPEFDCGEEVSDGIAGAPVVLEDGTRKIPVSLSLPNPIGRKEILFNPDGSVLTENSIPIGLDYSIQDEHFIFGWNLFGFPSYQVPIQNEIIEKGQNKFYVHPGLFGGYLNEANQITIGVTKTDEDNNIIFASNTDPLTIEDSESFEMLGINQVSENQILLSFTYRDNGIYDSYGLVTYDNELNTENIRLIAPPASIQSNGFINWSLASAINEDRLQVNYEYSVDGNSIIYGVVIMDSNLNVLNNQTLYETDLIQSVYSDLPLEAFRTSSAILTDEVGTTIGKFGFEYSYFEFQVATNRFVFSTSFEMEFENDAYLLDTNDPTNYFIRAKIQDPSNNIFQDSTAQFRSNKAADGGRLYVYDAAYTNFYKLSHITNGVEIWTSRFPKTSNLPMGYLLQFEDGYKYLENASNQEIIFYDFNCIDELGTCTSAIPGYTYLGEFEGSRYFLSDEKFVWEEAWATSIALGGYLASIGTEAENTFIADQLDLTNTMAFIGMTDWNNNEGNYFWASGEPVIFTKFEDTNTAVDDFVTMNFWNGGWSWDNAQVQRRHILEIPCTSTPNPNLPDLRVENLRVPNALESGQTYSILYDLNNQGTAVATGDYTIGLYLSTDATLSVDDDYVGQTFTGNTPIGTIADVSETFTVPNDYAAGTYYLILSADIEQLVEEADESNNMTVSNFLTIDPTVVEIEINNCPTETIILPAVVGNPRTIVRWDLPYGGDECSGSVTRNQISGPGYGSLVAPGEYLIAYEFTNECGGTATCSFLVIYETSLTECEAEVAEGILNCSEYLADGSLRLVINNGSIFSEYIYDINGDLVSTTELGPSRRERLVYATLSDTELSIQKFSAAGLLINEYSANEVIDYFDFLGAVFQEGNEFFHAGHRSPDYAPNSVGDAFLEILRTDQSGNILSVIPVATQTFTNYARPTVRKFFRVNEDRLGILYVFDAGQNAGMAILDNNLNLITDTVFIGIGSSSKANFINQLNFSENNCGNWSLELDYRSSGVGTVGDVNEAYRKINFNFQNDEFVPIENDLYSTNFSVFRDSRFGFDNRSYSESYTNPTPIGGILRMNNNWSFNFANSQPPNTPRYDRDKDTLFFTHIIDEEIIWSSFLVPAPNYQFHKLFLLGDQYYALSDGGSSVSLFPMECLTEENQPPSECPTEVDGYAYLGTFDGSAYFLSNERFTWIDGSARAADNGGYLASIQSEAENDFIFEQLDFTNTMAFIGLSDRGAEGDWFWDSGEVNIYFNLEEGNSETDDFATMNFWNGGWSLDNEDVQRPHVLEIPCEATEPTVGEECEENIQGLSFLGQYENNYYFTSNDLDTWQNGAAFAAANGGYLASFSTEAERDFVLELISEISFIGLNDENGDGVYEWDSDEPVNFSTDLFDEQFGNMNFWNGDFDFDGIYTRRKFIVEIPCEEGAVARTNASPSFQDEPSLTTTIAKVFPNPTSGNFNLEMLSAKDQLLDLEIYNSIGREVFKNKIDLTKGRQILNIGLDRLPNGVYLIKVLAEGGKILTKPLVVSKH